MKMKKEFNHNEKEICLLCKKEIETPKDEWVAIADFEKQKLKVVKFYHRNCLNDLFRGKGEIIAKNFEEKLGKFVKKMFGSAGVNQTNFGADLIKLSQ